MRALMNRAVIQFGHSLDNENVEVPKVESGYDIHTSAEPTINYQLK